MRALMTAGLSLLLTIIAMPALGQQLAATEASPEPSLVVSPQTQTRPPEPTITVDLQAARPRQIRRLRIAGWIIFAVAVLDLAAIAPVQAFYQQPDEGEGVWEWALLVGMGMAGAALAVAGSAMLMRARLTLGRWQRRHPHRLTATPGGLGYSVEW